jgi:hypothetical protein
MPLRTMVWIVVVVNHNEYLLKMSWNPTCALANNLFGTFNHAGQAGQLCQKQ